MIAPGTRTYTIYGIRLRSAYAFTNRLVEAEGEPDLDFVVAPEAPDQSTGSSNRPAFESEGRLPDGRPLLRVEVGSGFHVLRYTLIADFYVWPDRIHCHILDPEFSYALEIYFLGVVLSFWLERRGIRALHASAVTLDGRAVAFMGGNRSGKSSLAAAFMTRGFPMLTDDVLALENAEPCPVAHAGYPQMRFWPDQAAYFVGSLDDLPLVHPELDKRRVPVGEGGLGSFHSAAADLGVLYVPERRDPGVAGETVCSRVTPRDAVIELVSRSFLGPSLETLDLGKDRFQSLVDIARRTDVRRLEYPDGVDHLEDVVGAVLDDLQHDSA